ncbi:cytidine deaminase [soil metagenome]|jgi:cytidine deaminase
MEPRELLEAARSASQRAYAPYSDFHVGAVVQLENGTVYAGCNVENASYGLSMCAERNAVAAMVAGTEERKIQSVAVASPDAAPCMPCGACRQVLREFGCEKVVVEVESGPRSFGFDEILPHSFGPETL